MTTELTSLASNPFGENYAPDPRDEDLARRAVDGDASALDVLLRRHEPWIYNLALRMLQTREDAEDTTQEVLLKIATRLSSFRGDSAFRTWAYRIVINHALDFRGSAPEQTVHGFECLGNFLDNAPDEGTLASRGPSPEADLLVEETKLGCMLGMLLCLDREQRLVFILGAVFATSDALGSEVLNVSRDNFRQKLARARRDLGRFMEGRCGLMDSRNPCRCARKTQAFIKGGVVDPEKLHFAEKHLQSVQQISKASLKEFESAVEGATSELFKTHPFFRSPDLVTRLRSMLQGGPGFSALFKFPDPENENHRKLQEDHHE